MAAPRLTVVAHGPPLKQVVRVGPAEVAYVEAGSRSGPTVVLLHGFPTSSVLWRSVVAELGDDVHALVPDLPGLGDTDVSPYQDLGAPMVAELLLGWLERLGLDRVALVAHDTGAAVAHQVAAARPERLSHLALVAPVAYDRWSTAFWAPRFGLDRPGLDALRRAIGRRGSLRPVRAGLAAASAAPLDPYLVDELVRPLGSDDGWERARRTLLAADHEATLECTGALRALEVPAAVVWGADDPVLSPVAAARLGADLAGAAEPVVLAGCGHLVPVERPVRLAAELRALLARDRP